MSVDEVLPDHVCLRLVWLWYGPVLANWICGCPRAIAVPVERLLLTHAPPPIARGLAGELPERRGEGGLGGIAKRCRDRHDRFVAVAQHVHGLLEPVLAQPGMRRKPGAFLEGTAEVEARKAGVRSQRSERNIRIAIR